MIKHSTRVQNQAKYDHFVIRYQNRKLYLASDGAYISHQVLLGFIRSNESFVVYDDQTGKDVTNQTLRSIMAGLITKNEVPMDDVISLILKYIPQKAA